jgi:hypothetical protein
MANGTIGQELSTVPFDQMIGSVTVAIPLQYAISNLLIESLFQSHRLKKSMREKFNCFAYTH